MRKLIGGLAVGGVMMLTLGGGARAGQQPERTASPASTAVPPLWAYPVAQAAQPGTPPAPPPADDGSPKRLPGTAVTLTLKQVRDFANVPDWHPDDHPPMPEPVAHGRPKEMRACGFCHLVNGFGRPENASLAGLPAAYIVQQMADFKNGDRKTSEPKMGPPNAMIQDAKAAHDDEIKAAAAYFASVPYKKWIRVVEARVVPKSKISGSMHVPTNDGNEPLGQRIIEMPENLERTELRDASSSFVAYVPVGSIKKGEALAKSASCGTCHGADLMGSGPVPGIAGRSPSYLVRQLYDIKTGKRGGNIAPMQGVVSALELEDMIAIAAYVASQEP